MPFEKRVALSGSDRKPVPGATETGPIGKDETVQVTIVLNRRHGQAVTAHSGAAKHSRTDYGVIHGADPHDLDLVEQFAHAHGLAVVSRHHERRSIVLSGTAEAMQEAFGTTLKSYHVAKDNFSYRGRTGPVMIPEELAPRVMAVLGLDNRPVAKPHFRRKAVAAPAGTFTPPQVARLYNYPSGVTGAGQTIGILELGGGYKPKDITTYFQGLGIKAPQITAVSVDNGQNKPGGQADGEVMLDIEVAGSIAFGANIVVYFAPNTDQGFVDAVSTAANDATHKPGIISISWGGPEDSWTDQARTALNTALQDAAALGITVTVAAGDDGATDGVTDGKLHVDFPASSPFVMACGGTSVTASGGAIATEQVWNDLAASEGATGGGISNLFALPSYQAAAGVPPNPETNFVGRGVPDVSGDADPETGYIVRVDGKQQIIGGTSAVAPLWAALVALLNQQLGKPLGFANPALYQAGESVFRDIVTGNNDGYSAGKGWDPCTGLGSPNGTALAGSLSPAGPTT
jgi:kumamolisin